MTAYHVRWMTRRDMPDVLAIEAACFEFPWPEEEFTRSLRQKNCIGQVVTPANDDFNVLGFVIYELHLKHLAVLNVAVHPDQRRRGVGRAMLDKLLGKLSTQRRTRLTTMVRESNLDAQLFFRALGFRATGVLRDYYDNSDEDAYCFSYSLPSDVAAELEPQS